MFETKDLGVGKKLGDDRPMAVVPEKAKRRLYFVMPEVPQSPLYLYKYSQTNSWGQGQACVQGITFSLQPPNPAFTICLSLEDAHKTARELTACTKERYHVAEITVLGSYVPPQPSAEYIAEGGI